MNAPLCNTAPCLDIPPPTPKGEVVTGQTIKTIVPGSELSGNEANRAASNSVADFASKELQQCCNDLKMVLETLSESIDKLSEINDKLSTAADKLDVLNVKLDDMLDTLPSTEYGIQPWRFYDHDYSYMSMDEELEPELYVDEQYASSTTLAPIEHVDDVIYMSPDILRRYCSAYDIGNHSDTALSRNELTVLIFGSNIATLPTRD